MHIKRLKEKKKTIVVALIGSMLVSAGIPIVGLATASALEKEVEIVNTNSQKRNVMYYGDWSIWGGQGNFYPKDIPADQLTHLNFAFMDFDSNGNLVFTDKDAAVGAPVGQEGVQWGAPNAGVLIALQQLREENPNLKLGISLGGWSKSADFPIIAADQAKRTNFVNNVIKFVEYTNMDFVDLDWEFAGEVREPDKVDNKNDEGNPHASENDKENYIKLLDEFRVALDKKGVELGKTFELTVALPAPKKKVDAGIDVDRLFEIVDFANIMTYDMRGAWDEYSGHQTGLYPNPNEPLEGNNLSIDESVDYLIENGAESEKIVIGAAYYTRGWDKVSGGPDAKLPGLFGEAALTTKDADQTPSRGAINEASLTVGDGGRMSGVWSYRNLDKLKANYPGIKEYWDDIAKAPYLYDETTGKFFTYDNKRSIGEKTKYVNENNLGGVIGWMQSQDAPTTSTKRDELTKTTKEGLFGDTDLPKYEVVYSELDIDAIVTPYETEWGADRKGYEITIKNKEKAEESNEVLKEVERGAETIKAPKLYLKTDKPLNRGDHMAGTVTYENGYTIVDLKSVWEGKNIEQGQSYTLRLTGDAKIESIELAQRMSNNSPDMYKQTIYGEVTNPEKNQAPVLSGLYNKTIKVGDSFDKMAGVTATDKEDGDLTSKIKVIGNVDTSKEGKYELNYIVQDSKGLETAAERTITVEDVVVTPPQEDANFGVGQGIEWPSQVNAPFADMTAWNNGDFSNNGALNLNKIAQDTGVKFFNLGFIQSTGGVANGKVNWGWGGHELLSERHIDNAQYQGIKKAIKDIREIGGDITISLGGLNGVAPWEVTQDVDTLYNTYKEIVQGYGLTRLDLDIEDGATNKAHNIANAKAIKKVQDETNVDIVLTLAVMPTGLTSVQLDVLEAYLSQGVDVEVVNIMTMCYGVSVPDYAVGSVQAVDNTMMQVKEYFKKYANVELSNEQAYRKIGTTPSVGFEGSAHPIFDVEDTRMVVDHAIEKGIGMVSMWSINRDSKAQDNQGINNAYEHTNLMKKFGEESTTPEPEVNQAPVFKGIEDKTINLGDNFDKLAGVTASDKEDGDLTSKITVKGNVDINKVGKYTLTYSVTDSDAKETTKTRMITVKDSSIVEDTYDPTKIYYGGEVVIYKGEKYTAKWWVQGENPDKSQAWEKEVTPNEDGSINYEAGMVFTGGETVKYQGKLYKAKWWTNTVPGSDSSWEMIG
ncbi:MAG: glycosyl hydrolase family 18 protein [Peptostreptococcaceae bacterium]